jgi:flagellar hook-length control protein FliK
MPQAGEAASAQKPVVQTAQTQAAPVQTAPAQASQVQAIQAQTAQAPRKPASAPAESNNEIASTPVAAAPSGFSLVSAPVMTDSTGYTPAATPQAPAASLLSQTAVDNLNALSVQINKRNAEGATRFTMELHPADLGKVDVALSIGRDGKLTAHMTFDSDMTKAAFSAHESDLRQQLSATGLKLSDDALSFSTRLKTDAAAQAQAQTVNANARSADSSSGDSSQQQQQNPFSQADSQQGQQRPHSQHLTQMARTQAAADQAAAEADLAALNSAIDASAARLKYRQSSSRLALDLSV